MCTLAGPEASVAFTHLSTAAAAALTAALPPTSPAEAPGTARAECHEQGVLALMQARGIARERVCLLDPKAPQALVPSDGEFAWFLFGVRHPLPFVFSFCSRPRRGYSVCVYASDGDGWLMD
jgi:hypothetical protein